MIDLVCCGDIWKETHKLFDPDTSAMLETGWVFLELICKLEIRICELGVSVIAKPVIGLIGTAKSCPMIVAINSNWIDGQTRPSWGDGRWGKKGKKKSFLVLSPRPGPDGPNASCWYRQLREPISPFSMFNSVQLKQLFSRGWTILLLFTT